MTERYEVTSELQREFVRDPEVFGDPLEVRARSVHNIMKTVAGVPLRRPAWFFDVDEYGEGLADVGTHLVDTPVPDARLADAYRWTVTCPPRQATTFTVAERRYDWQASQVLDIGYARLEESAAVNAGDKAGRLLRHLHHALHACHLAQSPHAEVENGGVIGAILDDKGVHAGEGRSEGKKKLIKGTHWLPLLVKACRSPVSVESATDSVTCDA